MEAPSRKRNFLRGLDKQGEARTARGWRWLWWFIWEDNSIWSWLVNIALAFVLIKFIIYPGLGALLGTGYPIVAVVSSSMEHPGGFEQWWSNQCPAGKQSELYSKYGITPEDFATFPFTNGFDKGDVMILRSPKELAVGDILVFWAENRVEPIIHRIVQVKETPNGKEYYTKGDRNCGSAAFEQGITGKRMIGKALFRLPLLGWIKIGFVTLLSEIGVMN
jgi:hypothetical protein